MKFCQILMIQTCCTQIVQLTWFFAKCNLPFAGIYGNLQIIENNFNSKVLFKKIEKLNSIFLFELKLELDCFSWHLSCFEAPKYTLGMSSSAYITISCKGTLAGNLADKAIQKRANWKWNFCIAFLPFDMCRFGKPYRPNWCEATGYKGKCCMSCKLAE